MYLGIEKQIREFSWKDTSDIMLYKNNVHVLDVRKIRPFNGGFLQEKGQNIGGL